MEYLTASLTHATSWMNLDDILLSEIKQSQKDNTVWFHLYEILRAVKLTETESRMVVSGDWARGGEGNGDLLHKMLKQNG